MDYFSEVLEPAEERDLRRIQAQILPLPPTGLVPMPPSSPPVPDRQTIADAKAMFARAFKWKEEQYQLFVQISSDAGRQIGVSGFEFRFAA